MMRKFVRGVSLVEVMVGLAVLGIILSLAAPSFADLLNSRRVQAVAAEISSDLALARAESGLRTQGVFLYFNQNSTMSCYTIAYYGAGGNCDCRRTTQAVCNGTIIEFKTNQIPKKIGVTATALGTWDPPFAVGTVNFKSPQMTASIADFVVDVVGIRGSSLRIQLNGMGRISTCSPGGTMSGVAPC